LEVSRSAASLVLKLLQAPPDSEEEAKRALKEYGTREVGEVETVEYVADE